MGRTIQLVDKSRAVWYRPDVFGNREDPEPFRVLLLPMSAEDLERMREAQQDDTVERLVAKQRGSKDERPGARLVDAMIAKHVVGVEGYSVTDAAWLSTTPKSGQELLDAIYAASSEELALRNDIALALQERARLEAGLEKKSDTPSASFMPTASPQNNGRAPYAAPVAKTQTPTSPSKSETKTEQGAGVSQSQTSSGSPGPQGSGVALSLS